MKITEGFVKSGLEKLLNSSFIKDIYPMVDRITIDELNEDNGTLTYTVKLNTSDIKYETMYENGLDPHYLNDHHVKQALTFVGLKLPNRSFDVYKKNGDYLVGFMDNGKNTVFYSGGINGMKSVDLI